MCSGYFIWHILQTSFAFSIHSTSDGPERKPSKSVMSLRSKVPVKLTRVKVQLPVRDWRNIYMTRWNRPNSCPSSLTVPSIVFAEIACMKLTWVIAFPMTKSLHIHSITFASLINIVFFLFVFFNAQLISRKICIRPTTLTNSPDSRPCFILNCRVRAAIVLFSFEPYTHFSWYLYFCIWLITFFIISKIQKKKLNLINWLKLSCSTNLQLWAPWVV